MEISELSVAQSTINGMVISLVAIVVAAVVLMGFAKGKYNGHFRMGIIGAMVYAAPVLLVSAVLRALFSSVMTVEALENPFLLALVQAIPLGVTCVILINLFEGMFVKKDNTFGDTITFMAGFGGVYAIIQCGMGVIVSLMTALSINSNTAQDLIDTAKENELGELEETIRAIAESSWTDYVFKTIGTLCVAGVMVLTTLMVYECIQYGSKSLKFVANLELIVAMLTWQYISVQLSSLAAMIVILIITVMIGVLTYIVVNNLRSK